MASRFQMFSQGSCLYLLCESGLPINLDIHPG